MKLLTVLRIDRNCKQDQTKLKIQFESNIKNCIIGHWLESQVKTGSLQEVQHFHRWNSKGRIPR